MNEMNVGLIVRFMDQYSGGAAKLNKTLIGLKRSSKEFRRAFGTQIKAGFSEGNITAALRRSEGRITRSRARLMGAVGMGITLAAPVVVSGNFQEKLIDFANLADIGTERIKLLEAQIGALSDADKTGQSRSDLLDGLAAYVGKGMGLEEALASLEATGRASKATRALMGEMANSGFAVMDNLNVPPEQLKKVFDVMALSGKEGSFELAAMARKFPEITAGAKSLKMEGVEAVASLSAALQIAMKSAGSEDQAATNMSNFLGKITAPDTVKKFKDFGVNIEKEMQIAAKRGLDPMEHMLLVIEKMTGGDSFKMGQLFADKQVLDFLRAVIPNMEEYQRIKKKAAGAEGIIDKDYLRVMEGFNESARQVKNSLIGLFGASGALMPVFTELMNSATSIIDATTAWTLANPELTATIVKGAAALLAFGIATRVLGFGFSLVQGGLINTVSLFLKFDKAGKNISLFGKSLRGAGYAGGFMARRLKNIVSLAGLSLKWGSFLPRLAWKSLIKPLVWSSRLIPKIAWAGLAKMLSWRMLLVPLKWGARLIPGIGWAVLAGELAWHLVIKPLGWDKYITWENAAKAWDVVGDVLKWTAIVNPLAWVFFIKSSTLRNIWKALKGELSWSDVISEINWSEMLGIDNLTSAWNAAMSNLSWPSWLGGDAAVEVADPPLRNSLPMRADQVVPIRQGHPMNQSAPVHHNTFENRPEIKVTVPVQVHKTQTINRQKISEQVGREAARATRRSLDDAALAE